MANISRSIDILFNGKETISPTITKITRAFDALDASIRKVTEPLGAATDVMLGFEAAATAAAAAIGGFALKAFSDYQYAVIDLNKVLSESEKKDLPAAEAAIKSLAVQYGESTTGLVQNVTDFRRASFDLKDSLTLINSALELTSAANSDMATSTEHLIQIMKGFGLEAKDAAHVVDAINIVSDKYATTAQKLGTAIAKVSPLAKLAGVSLEELIGLVTPTIEVFQDGDEAATAWRRAMSKVLDNSNETEAALESMDIAQRNANGSLRSARDILFDVAKAFDTTTQSNQIFIASEIFGNRQVAKLLASLRDLGKVAEIETTAKMVDHAYTMKQVAERWDSLQVTFRGAIEVIKQVGISLGSSLAPAASKVLDAITTLFSSLDTQLAQGAFDKLLAVFDSFGSALSEYILRIGQNLPEILSNLDYSQLTASFRGIFEEISNIFDTLNIKTPEGLTQFLQLAVDSMGALLNTTRGVLAEFKVLSPYIVDLARKFVSLGSDQQKVIGQLGAQSKIFNATGLKGIAFIESLKVSMNGIADGMVRTSGAIQAVVSYIEYFALTISKYISGIGIIASTLFGTIQGKGFINSLDEATAATHRLQNAQEAAEASTLTGFDHLASGMRGLVNETQKVQSELADLPKHAAKTVSSASTSITEQMVYTWKSAFDDISKKSGDLKTDLVSTLTEVANSIMTRASDIKSAMENALAVDAWKNFKEESKSTMIVTEENVRAVASSLADAGKVVEYAWSGNVLSAVKDTTTKAVEYLGYFSDEQLALFNASDKAGAAMDKRISASYQPVKEVEPPADTKFKAAQEILRDELRYNADQMKEQYSLLATSVESDAARMTTAMETVSATFATSSDSLSGLYKSLASDDLDLGTKSAITAQIGSEQKRQEEAFELQKKLTEAQIDLLAKRAQALESGDALITVSGDGLQPHLESFMWEILSAIQVKASETYNSFLLGLA